MKMTRSPLHRLSNDFTKVETLRVAKKFSRDLQIRKLGEDKAKLSVGSEMQKCWIPALGKFTATSLQ